MAAPRLNRENVAEYAGRFKSVHVWVVGDVMLDRYFWGDVRRISPEAPVPVVKINKKSSRAGGAANVALNLGKLGVRVTLVGATGADSSAQELKAVLKGEGIDTEKIYEDTSRSTTEKVRIIAQNQQVVRADFEESESIPKSLQGLVLDAIKDGANRGDALIISDYGKGMIQKDYLKTAISAWRKKGKPVLIDPHVGHFKWYRKATLVTPNSKQAYSFFGASLDGEQSIENVGFSIRKALKLDAVLITRGEEGMSLFVDDNEHVHVPTVAKEVYDVTGAGDTVISVVAAGLGAGVPLLDAVVMANQAAGEVVKEIGTAGITIDRLVTAVSSNS